MYNQKPQRYYICEIGYCRYLTNNRMLSQDISHGRLFHSSKHAMMKGLETVKRLINTNSDWLNTTAITVSVKSVMATIEQEKHHE